MKRSITTLGAILALASVGAAELSYTIVDTNQETFYNNSYPIAEPKPAEPFYGQDAQFTRNAPSYRDNGDGTITDLVTGLIWQKGFEVMGYNEAMAAAKSFTLAGHSDWRLPTIKEAYSLILFSGVDASSRDMSSTPENAVPFISDYFDFKYGANGSRSIDTQMLSATKYVGSAGQRMQLVFGVNMADGRIKGYPLSSREGEKVFTVRFVRGAEYGVNDLRDCGDGTIADMATGLMWQQSDSGKGMNWQEALDYAQKMNKKKYLGYSDWRVPNAKELQSIVDYTRSPETTSSAAIDPLFEVSKIKNELGQVDYPFFWSSTTHASAGARNNDSAAAYVCFGMGLGNMQQMQGGMEGGGGMQRGGMQRGGMQRGGGGGNMPLQGATYQVDHYQQSQVGERNNSVDNLQQNRSLAQDQVNYNVGQMQQSRSSNQMQSTSKSSGKTNWTNIHGAGCQRSDPKIGNVEDYTGGRGPQGDAIRIDNYVRLVRDIDPNAKISAKKGKSKAMKVEKPIKAESQPGTGLVASWSFELSAKDSSANMSHGKAEGVSYVDGVVGKAAYFDGMSSKIIIPDIPKTITSLKEGTISCWFKFENRGGQVLPLLYLGKATSGKPNYSMVLEIGHNRGDSSNRRLYLTTIVGRGENFCVDSNTNLTPGKWYHYAAVVSQRGNTIYINGKEHTTRRYNLGSDSSYTTFFDDVPAKELLSIGYGKYSQEDPFYSFKGAIDEMAIYSRALSSEEILALYQAATFK
ncbi:MAG: DUF1566 domain-containing protein [Rikenellaceae bacterium]